MADRRGSARTRAAAPFLAGLLALGLGACSATPSAAPTIEPTIAPTPTPTAAPTQSAAPPTEPATPVPSPVTGGSACAAADLKASHDLVEGAAGSRFTNVVLVTASRCAIDAFPAMGLRDAHGAELVGSASGGPGRIDLDPNVSYTSAIRFDNWCNPEPAYPVALVIRIGAEEVAVSGSSFPGEGDMPPCNGPGGPTLEAGAWQAAP
jgi:hypothetical protein